MGIYICFGGCILLSAFWVLSVLMVKWIGSPGLSCVFDFILTIMVLAMFTVGLYLNSRQPNRQMTEMPIIQEESWGSRGMDEEQMGSIQELASPAQETLPDRGMEH